MCGRGGCGAVNNPFHTVKTKLAGRATAMGGGSCPSPHHLRLSPPLGTLQCPAGRDQEDLCQALQQADGLAASMVHRTEGRIEKALVRRTIGRCAGWLTIAIFRRHGCTAEIASIVPTALHECGASVAASDEPPAALGMLRFFTDAVAQLRANESSTAAFRTCQTQHFGARMRVSSLPPVLEAAYRPYAATTNEPIDLRCPEARSQAPPVGIPPLVHFVYALREHAPFGFMHLAAIQSAIAVHRPRAVLFHYSYLPSGEFWDAALATGMLSLQWIDPHDAGSFGGRCLRHVAHRADVLRLKVLLRHGGRRRPPLSHAAFFAAPHRPFASALRHTCREDEKGASRPRRQASTWTWTRCR